jgi:hypothetical protein
VPGRDPQQEALGWRLDHFSRGELERIARHGPRRGLRDVGLWLGGWIAVFAAAASVAVATLDRTGSSAAILPVLLIATAGLALTACGFHAARISAALRLRRDPVEPESIRRHLMGVVR